MTYSKEITHMIVECWGLGLSAEETRTYINQTKGVLIGLATVYRHRHGITASEMIKELMRKQRRDIAKEPDSDTRMKYRDKLLEKLIPKQLAFKTEHKEVSVDVKRIEVVELFDTYGRAVEAAVQRNIQSLTKDADKQQLDTTHTYAETS